MTCENFFLPFSCEKSVRSEEAWTTTVARKPTWDFSGNLISNLYIFHLSIHTVCLERMTRCKVNNYVIHPVICPSLKVDFIAVKAPCRRANKRIYTHAKISIKFISFSVSFPLSSVFGFFQYQAVCANT